MEHQHRAAGFVAVVLYRDGADQGVVEADADAQDPEVNQPARVRHVAADPEQRDRRQQRRADEEGAARIAVEDRAGGDHADAQPEGQRRSEQPTLGQVEAEGRLEAGLVRAHQHEDRAEDEEGEEAEREHRSEHAELELRRLGHHGRVPGRVPDEVEDHRGDALDIARLRLDLGR